MANDCDDDDDNGNVFDGASNAICSGLNETSSLNPEHCRNSPENCSAFNFYMLLLRFFFLFFVLCWFHSIFKSGLSLMLFSRVAVVIIASHTMIFLSSSLDLHS